MKAGDTFFLTNKSIEGGHPRILICDPYDGQVVVANLTEWAENKDQSCVIEASEETIVTKRSVVSYRDAALVRVSLIETHLSAGELMAAAPVSSATIEKILTGCGVTRFVKQEVFSFLDQLGLIAVI